MKEKYSKEALQDAVAHCTSVAGVIRFLGKPTQSGSLGRWVRDKIRKYEIDTNHFVRGSRGKTSPHRKTPCQVFQVTHRRVVSSHLRRALLESGVLYECSSCFMVAWRGKPLRLEVDHIDGNPFNNLQVNLRFLCPNCHSQEETTHRKHSYSNAPKEPRCPHREPPLPRCKSCSQKDRFQRSPQKTKIVWPADLDLIAEVKNTNRVVTARRLGVSEMAVRKRLKKIAAASSSL